MMDASEMGPGAVANQSILISGESGAGETVTVSIFHDANAILQYAKSYNR